MKLKDLIELLSSVDVGGESNNGMNMDVEFNTIDRFDLSLTSAHSRKGKIIIDLGRDTSLDERKNSHA